jgi:hypothetical protein
MSIHRILAAALAIVAIAAPSASARPMYDQPGMPAKPSPPVIDDGFDLDSAAIGAGSASVVLLLTAAGVVAVGQRRPRPTATLRS